ncbi:MAG: PKD domain-containing protein [Bacteroidales bacterium]|nr:PKD domain-containing protein [Bacteroidales bacterium]
MNFHLTRKNVLELFIMALFISLLTCTPLFSQELAIDFGRTSPEITVKEDNIEKLSITFSYLGVTKFSVETGRGLFDEIGMPGAFSIGKLGTPKLPATKKLIEIPHGAEVTVKVKNYSVTEYKLKDFNIHHPLMPVQPSIRKDQDADEVPFEFDELVYQSNHFIAHELASVEVLGVMRGTRIARLTVAPVSYNPVQGVIRVCNNIEVEITFSNVDQAMNEYIKASAWSPYFEVVQNTLLNRIEHGYPAHPDLTKYPVKYLIVSPRMFENDLQSFIQWKTKKGFKVIVGYTDQIGTTYAAIRTWVQNQYNSGTPLDPAPSFLLIVGDTPQIPATTGSASGKMTDLYYGSVDGDYFPEMYYGRFSATNSAQLVSQIAKTMYYEKYEFADPTYLDNATLIAGADATWNPRVGQPTILYGTNNYFNAAHGYNAVNAYLSSYSGCYDPARIAVSLINYTAHCSETSWGTPSLTQSMVNSFVNNGKYPVAIGNCCLAADFGYTECIGETWQRALNKGSVAYIGSSPSSYWFEDFYWSVGAFPIQGTNNGYVPTYAETSWGAYDAPFVSDYVTTGSMVFVGNLAVTEVHIQGYPSHSSPTYYWQAYNVLGDPSLVPYHTQASQNTVSHMAIFPIGLATYEVAALPGSYVAISKNGVLHGTALVDASGVATVEIDPVLNSGLVDIVVTKPQHIPYMAQVQATALEGPYIVLDNFSISDPEGNNNGQADYGEDISLNITIKNIGADASGQIIATITGTDPNVTISGQAVQSFGVIASGASTTVQDAFTLSVAGYLPDQYQASFQLQFSDGSGNWNSTFQITVNAPQLEIGTITIQDQSGGNGNGRLDPGEKVDAMITFSNSGSSAVSLVEGLFVTNSTYISVVPANFQAGALLPGEQKSVSTKISVAVNAPTAVFADVNLLLTSDSYSALKTFNLPVGVANNIENFETGNFSQFPWSFSGNANWTITNVQPYEGIYSAKSGLITHNQTSAMQVTVNVSMAGEVSFWYKVSSESNYDYLRFYIDNIEKNSWSGNVDWQKATYPLTVGQHVLKWAYTKDVSVNTGSDCAWVDLISFPSYVSPGNLAVNIMASQTSLDPGEFVQFYDISTGFPTSFLWTFEGGTPATSTSKNPLVTYNQSGIFNVTLQVSNQNGQATGTFENFISVAEPMTSQTIFIPAGWSGLSSCLIPGNPELFELFQPVINDLIILQSMNGVFYPQYNINTIGQWDYQEGYKIKTENPVMFDITGWQNVQQTLQLEAGWNLIPVMSACGQIPELLFNGISGNTFIVKEIAGTGIYWPAMGINTIGLLNPGRAYYVRVENPVTITFPFCN